MEWWLVFCFGYFGGYIWRGFRGGRQFSYREYRQVVDLECEMKRVDTLLAQRERLDASELEHLMWKKDYLVGEILEIVGGRLV